MPSRFGVCRNTSEYSRESASEPTSLRRRGVLGDGLGALGHGVLDELSGEGEAHGGLDLAGREGALLVVAHELAGLVGDLVKDIRDERVHDQHALGRDARVGVHLLEHLVDVDRVEAHRVLIHNHQSTCLSGMHIPTLHSLSHCIESFSNHTRCEWTRIIRIFFVDTPQNTL